MLRISKCSLRGSLMAGVFMAAMAPLALAKTYSDLSLENLRGDVRRVSEAEIDTAGTKQHTRVYNERGLLLLETDSDEASHTSMQTSFSYDRRARLLSEATTDAQGATLARGVYSYFGNYVANVVSYIQNVVQARSAFQYGVFGNLVSMSTQFSDGSRELTTYDYSTTALVTRLVRQRWNSSGALVSKLSETYDVRGTPVRRSILDSRGNVELEFEPELDVRGNWVRLIGYTVGGSRKLLLERTRVIEYGFSAPLMTVSRPTPRSAQIPQALQTSQGSQAPAPQLPQPSRSAESSREAVREDAPDATHVGEGVSADVATATASGVNTPTAQSSGLTALPAYVSLRDLGTALGAQMSSKEREVGLERGSVRVVQKLDSVEALRYQGGDLRTLELPGRVRFVDGRSFVPAQFAELFSCKVIPRTREVWFDCPSIRFVLKRY